MAEILKENKNYLLDELEELNETISEIEELYSDSKEVLDEYVEKSRRPNSRTSPVFIAQQTSNLISIKEKKIHQESSVGEPDGIFREENCCSGRIYNT